MNLSLVAPHPAFANAPIRKCICKSTRSVNLESYGMQSVAVGRVLYVLIDTYYDCVQKQTNVD